MSEQRHIIRRQVLELHVPERDVERLQDEVNRVFRQRIIPLIDRHCTELSSPDRIDRIDSLVIDIGHIDPNNLEAEMVEKISPQLRKALEKRIPRAAAETQNQEQTSKSRSQLELLTFFARTGSVPWWADASEPRLLEKTISYLLAEAPKSLVQVMRTLVREDRARQRFIVQFSDEQLSGITALLAPSFTEAPLVAHRIRREMETYVDIPEQRMQFTMWQVLLQTVASAGMTQSSEEIFYRGLLKRLASAWGTRYTKLLEAVDTILNTKGERREDVVPERAKIALASLSEAPREEVQTLQQREDVVKPEVNAEYIRKFVDLSRMVSTYAPRLPFDQHDRALELMLEMNQAVIAFSPVQRKPFLELIETLRLGLLHYLKVELSAEISAPSVSAVVSTQAFQDLTDWLSTWGRKKKMSSEKVLELLTSLQRVTAGQPADPIDLGQTLAAEDETAPVDINFTDSDSIYIGNAGLVIFWPFLTNFFTRAGLVEEKQFVNEAARHRAVAMLQYVASGEVETPEYALPLNKVLCGMQIADVFDAGQPLSVTEIEECNMLIQAVISNAEIIRNTSSDGLRGNFLLREGVLSQRDGAWLLQVENKTYDVVLDRFPWSWTWVRLPWMETALRVEW